ncbi:MAG: sel1 repeat family protein [Candidatus Paracaedibacteraceae bacterium]|nr:sel1 repeat family protein [Candidatus Paracaedibacteraceae bacterium]
MTIASFFTLFALTTSTALAASGTDEGISLMYQGKPDEALTQLKPLGDNGDIKAAFYVSLILLFGDKTTVTEGMAYLQKAVNAGYGPALDTLAGLYLHGDLIPRDIHKAKMYYEIASQRGYGSSQFNFGIMSKNGEGVPQDLEDAYVYLSLAADNYDDLGDLTQDAEKYRNEVRAQLDQDNLDRVHKKYEHLKSEITSKQIDNS